MNLTQNQSIITAAIIIGVSIVIYGLMQIYASNAQRYHLYKDEGCFSVFDKRTGRIYHVWDYVDAVKGERVKRGFRESATEDQK